MAHGACGGASPRPLRYDRGVARRSRCSAPGPGLPDRRLGCPSARPASRTTGFPDNGRSAAACAEFLRRAQDMPWTSGWPRRCRHTTATTWELRYTHNQRITSAACLAALAAKGPAPRLAPRHYRISANTFGCAAALQFAVTIGGSDGTPAFVSESAQSTSFFDKGRSLTPATTRVSTSSVSVYSAQQRPESAQPKNELTTRRWRDFGGSGYAGPLETATRFEVVSSDEPLILVDEQNRRVGTLDKSARHDGDGLLHRAFSLFVFNLQGETLLQRRHPDKRLWPGYWSNACCSHPRDGELLEDAVLRRAEQELGLVVVPEFLFKFR